MNILVEYTNKYINENKASCSRDRHAKNTSKKEMSALIGLINSLGYTRAKDKIWTIYGRKMVQELIYCILLRHYDDSNFFFSASGMMIKPQELKD